SIAALQGLAHDLGIAYALERVVGAAISQLNDAVDDIFNVVGIDVVRHAELACHGFALGIQVYTYDVVGPNHFGALNHVKPYASQPKHHHIGACLDFGGEHHGSQPCCNAAAYVADLVEGCIVVYLGQRNFGNHNVVGKCG